MHGNPTVLDSEVRSCRFYQKAGLELINLINPPISCVRDEESFRKKESRSSRLEICEQTFVNGDMHTTDVWQNLANFVVFVIRLAYSPPLIQFSIQPFRFLKAR